MTLDSLIRLKSYQDCTKIANKSYFDALMVKGQARRSQLNFKPTLFDSAQEPSIHIASYLERICRFSLTSQEALVHAIILVKRASNRNPNLTLWKCNIHRLMLTAIVISVKYFDDDYVSNAHHSRIGGVSLKELNLLERELLFMLQFDLFVDRDEYQAHFNEIVSYVAPTTGHSAPCPSQFLQRIPEEFLSHPVVVTILNSNRSPQAKVNDVELFVEQYLYEQRHKKSQKRRHQCGGIYAPTASYVLPTRMRCHQQPTVQQQQQQQQKRYPPQIRLDGTLLNDPSPTKSFYRISGQHHNFRGMFSPSPNSMSACMQLSPPVDDRNINFSPSFSQSPTSSDEFEGNIMMINEGVSPPRHHHNVVNVHEHPTHQQMVVSNFQQLSIQAEQQKEVARQQQQALVKQHQQRQAAIALMLAQQTQQQQLVAAERAKQQQQQQRRNDRATLAQEYSRRLMSRPSTSCNRPQHTNSSVYNNSLFDLEHIHAAGTAAANLFNQMALSGANGFQATHHMPANKPVLVYPDRNQYYSLF